MSKKYDRYLEEHIGNVKKGFKWLQENLPELFEFEHWYIDSMEDIINNHDKSKYSAEEYEAYDNYFYGINGRSYEMVEEFKIAWLHHIHNNPHHWQHWILVNDDGPIDILDMPYVYIIEMICDWWSFGWLKNDPYELFDWYDSKKYRIQLSNNTRDQVETILSKIKEKLDNNERE